MNYDNDREDRLFDIKALEPYFKHIMWRGHDEVFFYLHDRAYSPQEVLFIVNLLGQLTPDELEVEDNEKIRLWWD